MCTDTDKCGSLSCKFIVVWKFFIQFATGVHIIVQFLPSSVKTNARNQRKLPSRLIWIVGLHLAVLTEIMLLLASKEGSWKSLFFNLKKGHDQPFSTNTHKTMDGGCNSGCFDRRLMLFCEL